MRYAHIRSFSDVGSGLKLLHLGIRTFVRLDLKIKKAIVIEELFV